MPKKMNLRLREMIGDRIRAMRERQGLSQTALARASGLDNSMLAHVEYGRRGLSIESVIAIADALGVTTDVLFGRSTMK